MPSLDPPDVLHPLPIKQGNSKGVPACGPHEHPQQLLQHPSGGLLTKGRPPSMESPLLPGQMLVDVEGGHTLGLKLQGFCFAQQS